ncbi:MAG: rRNA maturation RNase YbeY [Alphaproteobacteria bacterium]|nr:rRNA maturation RNase YbeY [Alphaproteobacteria bacterium]
MAERLGRRAAIRSSRRGLKAPESDIAVLVQASGWRRRFVRPAQLCRRAALAALRRAGRARRPVALAIVLTDDSRMRDLNRRYRGQDKPTNVLSFTAESDQDAVGENELIALGDVVLAFETVAREARTAGKSVADHTAHLVIHGVLHLLGYDHENARSARAMEALEVGVLAGLGIADPYRWDARS